MTGATTVPDVPDVLFAWVAFFLGHEVEAISDMLLATLTPLLTLVSAATGFYYGRR